MSRLDGAGFEQLYRATRADLLGYLVRRARSPEEAADLLAETYLIAWEKLDKLPPEPQIRLWLFGVARNLCLQRHRRTRVADALVERLAVELRSLMASADEPIDEHLWQALKGLPAGDREIVALSAWEGLTPREIAVVVGGSANAVRIRLHRARRRLMKQLEEDSADGDLPYPAVPGTLDRLRLSRR